MISTGLLAVALVLALLTKPISTSEKTEKLIEEQIA
jgi:hypothetical protein